jgi:hypothetical protein
VLSEQSNKGSPHFRGGEMTAFQRKATKMIQRQTIKKKDKKNKGKRVDAYIDRSIICVFVNRP